MGLILEGWVLYNLLRQGVTRSAHTILSRSKVEDLAKHFLIDIDQLYKLQAARRIVLKHDRHGRLIASRH
jgi:hypothetical protein